MCEANLPSPSVHLQVTVVDYDADSLNVHSPIRGASELTAFLARPRPSAAKVRWIHLDGAGKARRTSSDILSLCVPACPRTLMRSRPGGGGRGVAGGGMGGLQDSDV